MGMWQIRLAVGLLVCAGWAASWPVAAPAEEKAPAKAPAAADAPKPDETAIAKIEKQITGIEDRMKTLQQEEFQVSMAAVTAQKVADGADVEKYRQELEKGSKKREHLEYRAAMESAAGQWRTFADKYERIVNMTKTLERDRDKAPPEVQAKIDGLAKRANDKYRSILDKVMSNYEKCADYRNVLQIYQAIYQSTPEAKRDRGMKKELAGLYKKAGDAKNSLALYKSMFDAIPEKERLKDRGFVEEVATFYKDMGDFRNALLLYKALWDALPEKDRGKDGNLGKALAEMYEKVGDLRAATLVYKAVWNATAEKDRGKDWGMGEKLGELCDKMGDFRAALSVYQISYDAMSDGDRKDKNKGGKLNNKIVSLKAKLGISAATPAADGGNTDTQKKNYKR
jgi:tetratricopeptide (TPR) repeat protein